MNKKHLLPLVLILLMALLACGLPTAATPTQDQNAIYTAAAQTIAAQAGQPHVPATETPPLAPTNTEVPTLPPTPTDTLVPSATSICDKTQFVNETVPDGTVFAPGAMFTKTWRVRNVGACTWTAAYAIVFDHGDHLGAPDAIPFPGNVAPGQEVDLSINMQAPITPGAYESYWKFRNASGVIFVVNPYSAKITVVATHAVTLNPLPGESGTIRADGGPWPDYTAGESNADITKTVQAFLSYDISSIPSNATITEVKIDFTNYAVTGNPFGLSVLNGYVTNYGPTLEAADFVAGFPAGNTIDWGSTAALNIIEVSPDLKTPLQSKVGTSRLQLRLQFAGSNLDAVKDRITFTNPSLIVKYTTP